MSRNLHTAKIFITYRKMLSLATRSQVSTSLPPVGASLLLAAALALCTIACARREAWLEVYTGYGTPAGGMIVGRAHRGTRESIPQQGTSTARRVVETLEAFEAEPAEDAAVVVTVAGSAIKTRTDDRGYFQLDLDPRLSPPTAHITVKLEDSRFAALPVTLDLPVFTDGPGLAVISDVDDTLLDTGVDQNLTMIKNTFTNDTWRIIPIDGAAAAVKTLVAGRPLVYISGSPWGLSPRITEAFKRLGFPDAPMVLKRITKEPALDQLEYKWPHIIRLVDALPGRTWILLGDSTEKDPEVYARLEQQRPGRVAAIYIHLVGDARPDDARFQGMKTFSDWKAVVEDAQSRKLLP
jgi:phosphatidate phosphatase APP1